MGNKVKGMMKNVVVLMMVVSLLLGSLPSFGGSFVKAAGSDVIRNDETGIPDKALYQMILKALDKTPDSTFTEEEAQKVEWLSQELNSFWPDDRDRKEEDQVVSLQGIEKLTNLRAFATGRSKITDLKPLEHLKNLTGLSLRYCFSLTSIEGIRNCTQLIALDLPSTLTDISPVEGMTELTSFVIIDSDISTLPDLTKLTKLVSKDTHLERNNLTKAELTTKLPKQLVDDKVWFGQMVDLQKNNLKKLKKTLKVTSPKKMTKITSKTKKIVGKAGKNLGVELYYRSGRSREKLIKSVKADKNGVFTMKNLNLKKYKKKKLILESYYFDHCFQDDPYLMKKVTFKVKK